MNMALNIAKNSLYRLYPLLLVLLDERAVFIRRALSCNAAAPGNNGNVSPGNTGNNGNVIMMMINVVMKRQCCLLRHTTRKLRCEHSVEALVVEHHTGRVEQSLYGTRWKCMSKWVRPMNQRFAGCA